jgi:hypothetical protein
LARASDIRSGVWTAAVDEEDGDELASLPAWAREAEKAWKAPCCDLRKSSSESWSSTEETSVEERIVIDMLRERIVGRTAEGKEMDVKRLSGSVSRRLVMTAPTTVLVRPESSG